MYELRTCFIGVLNVKPLGRCIKYYYYYYYINLVSNKFERCLIAKLRCGRLYEICKERFVEDEIHCVCILKLWNRKRELLPEDFR